MDVSLYSQVNPCRSRFFVDIGFSSEIAPVAIRGLQKWLSKLLGADVPDAFSSDVGEQFARSVVSADIRGSLSKCNLIFGGSDQYGLLASMGDHRRAGTSGDGMPEQTHVLKDIAKKPAQMSVPGKIDAINTTGTGNRLSYGINTDARNSMYPLEDGSEHKPRKFVKFRFTKKTQESENKV